MYTQTSKTRNKDNTVCQKAAETKRLHPSSIRYSLCQKRNKYNSYYNFVFLTELLKSFKKSKVFLTHQICNHLHCYFNGQVLQQAEFSNLYASSLRLLQWSLSSRTLFTGHPSRKDTISWQQILWMHVMLPLTKGHFSIKNRIVSQKGGPY